jgi:protein tyrosine phosphatase (PTP) superfamily phosphohydrolase (DUF442 family)
MNIQKFYQYDEMLATGAQPTSGDISGLKENGFEVVVNISPASARNSLKEESQLVEQQNMDYVHFPVDCSNLRPIHFNTFKGIMKGLEDKKVFVHCGGNIKSSNLLHMYHVLEKGVDEAASLNILKQIQEPEEKWFNYFQKMGMKGINN